VEKRATSTALSALDGQDSAHSTAAAP
jgi:hypothetical protein